MRGALLVLFLARAALASDADLLRLAVAAEERLPRAGTQRLTIWPERAPLVSTVELAVDGQGRVGRRHTAGPGTGLVVIAEGAWEWRREPGSEIWQRGANLGQAGPGQVAAVERLLTNYRLSRDDGGQVAGRATHLLRVVPKAAKNPSRSLWIDRASRLVLRAELRNREGDLIGRTEYTKIAYRPPGRAAVSLPAGARRSESTAPGALVPVSGLTERDRRLGRRSLQPTSLPPGFALQATYLRACRRGGWAPVTTWSDGLNVISVMEPAGPGGRGRGRGRGAHRGCQIVSDRLQVVVRATAAGRAVVVVGDFPEERLASLAQSLR